MNRGICFLSLLAVSCNLFAQGMAGLIPTAAELAGFKITEAAEYYNPDNLWNYIDGGAPGYLAYGFEQVATFVVVPSADDLEFVVDIYDMGTALNAFGIYSTERSPEGVAVNVGSEGYRSENALFFWQDRYYVKIVSSTAAPAVASASMKLASILSRKLPPGGAFPKLFSVFPKEERVARSERFLARDVIGQEFLRNGYVVEYARKDAKYRVFLVQGANAGEVRQNFQEYRRFVESNGTVAGRPSQIGEEAFAGKAGAYGEVLAARRGRYMLGVLGLGDREAARAIVLSMLSKLEKE
jgi:hypothetical protein